MALVEATTANRLNSEYENYKKAQNYDFLSLFNSILDEDSQKAEPSMTNVDITTVAGSLNITYVDPKQQTLEIATKYMTYWGNAIATSGIPVTLPKQGFIVSVVNDAMSYVSPCKAELDAIAQNVKEGENPYMKFIEVLYKYAKSIKWQIVENWVDKSSGATIIENYTVSIS